MARSVEGSERAELFRSGIASGDPVVARTDACLVADSPERLEGAESLVALVVDGLRPIPDPATRRTAAG